MPIRVAMIAAECEPWAKVGGLADVVDALARALGQVGGQTVARPVDVFLPRYRGIELPADARSTPVTIRDPLAPAGATDLQIGEFEARGYRLRLVDHPPAFDREGYYGDAAADYPDNAWRFGLFCRAALEALRRDETPPDVLHLHDWHAAPAALYRDGPLGRDSPLADASILLTIHNLAYHGWTPRAQLRQLGKPGADVPAGLGDAAGLDLLKAGIERAELVNTVSPGFAREALGPELGMGLDQSLRAKGGRFFGILNGLDTDLWNPATDRTIAATFSAADRRGKLACRTNLLTSLGLDPKDRRPVLAMIGRLDPQKGFDLLAGAAPDLLRLGVRLIVLGSGHPELVGSLRQQAAARPDRIALIERFDRALARRIYAGADGFLMPSRFEPCGTGQMIALRYGTPPIVRSTGGLRDTVIDVDDQPEAGTGFRFDAAEPAALTEACERFLARFEAGNPDWERLLDRAMAVNFDWRTRSAPAYVDAYRQAVSMRAVASTR